MTALVYKCFSLNFCSIPDVKSGYALIWNLSVWSMQDSGFFFCKYGFNVISNLCHVFVPFGSMLANIWLYQPIVYTCKWQIHDSWFIDRNNWVYCSDCHSHRSSLGELFQKLFAKFWFVNKHGISERELLALYRHKEILVNSYLKATKKTKQNKKKMAWIISKIQVSDPGPSWWDSWTDSLIWKPWPINQWSVRISGQSLTTVKPKPI